MKKVTIVDVAKKAGVAVSTVSHVLNNTANVSEATKTKVLEAIDWLEYRPDAIAKAMRQKHTGLIGVVVQDITGEFYAKCTAKILKLAEQKGYATLLCNSVSDKESAVSGVNALIERRVDGLIFAGGCYDNDIITKVKDCGIPIVLGDRKIEGISSVRFDNKIVLENLTEKFYKCGYRKFLYMSEPTSIQDNLKERYEGFLKISKKYPDVRCERIFDDILDKNKIEGGYKLFKERIKQDMPDIIFTSNDMIAIGVISAAIEEGIRVPDDIAVVGFDDVSISKYVNPPLTTIFQDAELLGKKCFEMYCKIVENDGVYEEILTPEIKIRKSAILKEKD